MTRRILLLLTLATAAYGQSAIPVSLPLPVQDKNFYLLSLIEGTPAVRDAVKADAVLSRLAADTPPFQWSESQSAEAGGALRALYRSSSAMRGLVDGPLRASGMYVRYHQYAGDELLERAWLDCVRGINHLIDIYDLGRKPRYDEIDSMIYDPAKGVWKGIVQTLTAFMDEDRASMPLFFEPSLRFALEVMALNGRDEAGRAEPMEKGENAAAVARIRTTDWSRYPYSVIVVPGSGPDRAGVRISPGSMLRDELAAKRFHEGKAPFILVSGGYVHPAQTEYSEALEMKRDLITRFGVPAAAIIVDPHARHTTTNLRNAARLIYRYGMPFDKKALVTTDLSQSKSIEDPAFEARNMRELGYMPCRVLGRISPFDLEFLPRIESLHADPQDPLDP